jgi:glycerophosphoryl diester phosphodiesterase
VRGSMALTDVLQKCVDCGYRWIPQPKPTQKQLSQAKIIAHRGAWDHKNHRENTLSAFDRCLDTPIWGIEFDVRWTRDQVPVVHHDESLKRVFNLDVNVSELTFAELKDKVPLVPSLKEIVDKYESRLHLMIELKDKPNQAQAQKLKEVLSSIQAGTDYHLMSFDRDCFENLDFFISSAFVSIANFNVSSIYQKTLSEKWGGLTGHYLLIKGAMIHGAHQQKVQVGTGFPDSKNTLYREINRGVDWVFTNHALKLSSYL